MVEQNNVATSTTVTQQQKPNAPQQRGPTNIKDIGKVKVFMNQRLGSGVTSQVYKGSFNTGEVVKKEGRPDQIKKTPVAVKVIQKNLVEEQNMQKFLNQEFDVLRRVRHPNIVEFMGFERTKSAYYFIFELCEGGNFQDYLRTRGALPEHEAQKFFKQIADAMILLNQLDVIHRDLKPANILLTKDNKIKLADFGLARQFQPNQGDALLQTHVGTPYYKAPEIYHQQGYADNVDLWSLGIMLFQMVAGTLPFTAMSEQELFQKIRVGSFALPAGIQISSACKDLISRLIQESPERRMNYRQFREHPFVSLQPDAYRIYLEKLQLQLNQSTNSKLAQQSEASSQAQPVSVPVVERVEESKDALVVQEAGVLESSDLKAKIRDVENAITLTLSRASALEKVYKSQIEDKAEIGNQVGDESKVKMMIYNICREIKQVIVIFTAFKGFSSQSDAESSETLPEALTEKWLIITRIGQDFETVREDELASQPSTGEITNEAHKHFVFPRVSQSSDQATYSLKVRYSVSNRSTNSSSNEQTSESQQSCSEPIQVAANSTFITRTHVFTEEFLRQLRNRVNTQEAEQSELLDRIIALCELFKNLSSIVSDLSFVADQHGHQTMQSMNVQSLFLYALTLQEKGQDSLKLFEEREALAQLEAALTIAEELLYEFRLAEMETSEESKVLEPKSSQVSSCLPEAYTFQAVSQCELSTSRFLRFDETNSETVNESTLLFAIEAIKRQVQTLKENGAGAGTE